MTFLISLISFFILIFILNIPFGYWRKNVRKFSLQWYLAIHIPVIPIVLSRLVLNVGYAWFTYIIGIILFFTGQMVGSGIHSYRQNKEGVRISSCLFMDLCSSHHH